MKKINLRKAIPIIGAISSGKSFFVDSLLGLDILDSQSSITTKFVCIIQNHKNLKEPRFYQINLIENRLDNDTNMMTYEGTMKGDIIIGHDKIKEKIKEINKIQKEIPNDKIKFEELFYVLEIEIKNIKNDKLLDNYDFYDIPGLDEYIIDKNDNNNQNNIEQKIEKSNNNMKYIEGLFKYFKSRIDFGVFVLNAESVYTNSSKEVIANVANTIKPKKIHNYLIVLNKIDRQSEPNTTIKKLKSIITNNLLDQLNLSDNKFIPLDSRQLKHQMLLKESFEDYLLFLFNQYVTKSVIPFKDNRKGSKEEDKYNTKNYSFFEFLFDNLTKGKDKEQIEEYIEELESKFDDNYNFDDLKLNEIYEKIKNIENYKINYGIDLDDDESIKLFKGFYICFKEKINLPNSENVNKIFNYFDTIQEKLNKNFNDDGTTHSEEFISQDFRTEFEKFTTKFKRFYEENKNFKIIGQLSNSIEQLYNYIENQQIIYIGIFGNSSTGKSVIYNNIFGFDILTVNENECTKRGIIIEDGENIAMYKAISEIKKLNGKEFNIFKRSECIARGEYYVKEMLEQLNMEYAVDTDNNDLNYFIITIPIRFFNELNFDKEIRRTVKFIDLPGYNTSKSSNFIYEPIIESISCFLMTFKASSIGSTDNLKSASIYQNLKYKSKRAVKSLNDSEFLKCCLFTINLWNQELPTEEKLKDWSNTIKRFILRVLFENDSIDLKLSYLNALVYHNFLEVDKFYSNHEYLLQEIFKEYNKKNFKFGKKSFIKFFSDFLKKSIKNSFNINEKETKNIILKEKDSKIYEEMKILFENSYETTGFLPKNEKDYEKCLSEICSYLSYAQKYKKNIADYKNSYIEKFFKDLSEKIKFSKEFTNKDFKEHLMNAIDIFNIFFNIDIEKQNIEKINIFKQESEELYNKIDECFNTYNFEKLFDDYVEEIINFFNSKIDSSGNLLFQNDNNVEKALEVIIEEYKKKLNNFQINIKDIYSQFIKSVEGIYNNLVKYLEVDKEDKESVFSAKYGFKANIGSFVGKLGLFYSAMIALTVIEGIFPPLMLITIPAAMVTGLFFGKSLSKTLKKMISNHAKLVDALEDLRDSQKNEITLMKERFLRDLKEKRDNIKSNTSSLINIKVLELSDKSDETKQFYIQLKKDYEHLLNNIKKEFNL